MGRVKKLEIENFKSYSGKHSIGPFDDFTCIVGPNGAGKSNLMDAISFVLGVQSKYLRSVQLKDLIFRRTASAVSQKKAVVKLFYEDLTDNPVESSSITFARVISSSGVTSYQINNTDVTYEAYENQLEKIGVLVKVRNFLVFQGDGRCHVANFFPHFAEYAFPGDIESIAQKSPAEFSKLFEQISGSDHMRIEYEAMNKKKIELEESMIIAMQKKKILATQRKEIKDQKDEADMYFEKKEELQSCKTNLTLWKLYQIKCSIYDKQNIVDAANSEVESLVADESKIDQNIQNEKKVIAGLSKQCANLEKKGKDLKRKYDKSNLLTVETSAKLINLGKRKTDLDNVIIKLKKDSNNQVKILDDLEAEIKDLIAEKTKIGNDINVNNSKQGQLSPAQYARYLRLKDHVASLTGTDSTECNIIEKEMQSVQMKISRISKEKETAQLNVDTDSRLLLEHTQRYEHVQMSALTLRQELEDIKRLKSEYINALNLKNAQIEKARTELEDIRLQLTDAQEYDRRSKQELKEQEAVDTMKRIFSGVHGKLVDLCRPIHKKYAQAIATAAGKHMDAIVVDSKTNAAECIKYLKDQRVGTFLFLPLDNLSVKPVPERLRTLGQNYHVCVDLLECDDKFKPALVYAIGSSIVCDTLEDARTLCFERKERVQAVTLRGFLIGKSGAMTGGMSNVREGGDSWKSKELDTLRNRQVQLEKLLTESNSSDRQSVIDIENRYQVVLSKLQYHESEIDTLSMKIKQKAVQIENHKINLTELEERSAQYGRAVDQLNQSKLEISSKISIIEQQIFGEFLNEVGIASLQDLEQNSLQTQQTNYQRIKNLNDRLIDLQVQHDYETKKDFKPVLLKYEQQMSTLSLSIKACEQMKQGYEKEVIKIESNIKELEAESQGTKKEMSEHMETSKSLQLERMNLAKKKNSLLSTISQEEIGSEKLRSALHDILQQARIEEILLPSIEIESTTSNSISSDSLWDDRHLKWDGNSSSYPGSSTAGGSAVNIIESAENEAGEQHSKTSSSHAEAASSHFSQSQNPIVLKDSHKMRCVDLSSIMAAKTPNSKVFENVIVELTEKISIFQDELNKIQPNMHAAEKYEAIVEKYNESNAEFEALKLLTKNSTADFEHVKRQRIEKFKLCYEYVTNSLSVIYRDLTRSSKHPLGGNAFLTVENTDEPYLGGIRFTAMPPMKRFRDMDQLSGGEKTMAALALLFSLHSFRQAPFFVLDEIDAALDNVNVKKIANYIRQRSQDFQCIVISLKDTFYENADMLVGVCKDTSSLSSSVLSLNMKLYGNHV